MPKEDKENVPGPKASTAPTKAASLATKSPYTPAHAARPIRVVQPGPTSDELPSMAELLAWKNVPASFCAMAFGCAFCLLASFAFSQQTPFLSGAHLPCLFYQFPGPCMSAGRLRGGTED